MRFILILLCALFVYDAHAESINIDWIVDNETYTTTTCNIGDDLILPTAPTKYGYTFQGWADYIPIEYLESTGTQYIDTGIVAKSGLNTKMKLSITDATNGCALGTNDGGQFHPTFWYQGDWDSVIGIPDQNGGPVVPNYEYITEFKSDLNGFRFYVNGVLRNSGTAIHGEIGRLWMFRRSGSGNNWPMTGKIFYVQIYDGDTLVRDFIPVLDSDSVPCMYDKISLTCFYNAGTGNFIAGPVIE